jgi:hypothetical protein
MRWSPGRISPNIEDRRFDYPNPEAALMALQDAARRGDLINPYGAQELPPWMQPGPPTQEAAVSSARTQLTPDEERAFQAWFAQINAQLGGNLDADHPDYDIRAFWRATQLGAPGPQRLNDMNGTPTLGYIQQLLGSGQ